MCQLITFSFKGRFKTNNRVITTFFQGEVKYLNLINRNFSKVLNLIQVQFACDCLIKGFLIGVTFSRLHTGKSIPRIPGSSFTFQFITQNPEHVRI